MSRRNVSQSIYRSTFILLIMAGVLIAALTPNSGMADSSSIDPLPGQQNEPDSTDGTNAMPGGSETPTDIPVGELIFFLWLALL